MSYPTVETQGIQETCTSSPPLCVQKRWAFLQLTRLLQGDLGGCSKLKALGLCSRSEYQEWLIVAGELSLNLAVTLHYAVLYCLVLAYYVTKHKIRQDAV